MIGSVQFAYLRKGKVKRKLLHNLQNDWLKLLTNQKAEHFDQKSDYRRNDEYCMISGFGRTQGKSYFTQL